MKKLFLIIALTIGIFPFLHAQETTTNSDQLTAEDYERYINAKLEIEFRESAYEALGLTEEEIIAFDPLFSDYMNAKSELVDKKFRLMEEFTEEMKEDDSAKDERDEKGDFIEDYWEIEIDEMQLKKKYFDRMDEILSPRQAMNFFLLEENLQNRIKDSYVSHYIPVIIEVEKPVYEIKVEKKEAKDDEMTSKGIPNMKYKNDIDAFSNWFTNHQGKVSLDHNYTHDGLHKLLTAVDAVAMANNTDLSAFADQKNRLKTLANGLQKNKYSDKHADKAREAFTISAELLRHIQATNNFDDAAVKEVASAALKIDPDVLMTKQADHIYNFFDKAMTAINKMSAKTNWVSK